jgi:2-methylisocitrate lyase-like PEP mutase family enzyme
MRTANEAKAVLFRRLHDRSQLLVLANVWDVASARLVEQAGFPAIASTSAGIAWMLGYADGEQISRHEMLDMVRRIVGAVSVPVTADMESGYGATPADAAATARSVADVGAIGMNLEDTLPGALSAPLGISAQSDRIRAVREAVGPAFVINARTDVFLHAIGPESERLDHAIRRANAYRQAGADCLFVPGVRDAKTIEALVRNIHGPVNMLAGPDTPSLKELARLGVARVSYGSSLNRAMLTYFRGSIQELHSSGTVSAVSPRNLTHAQMNELIGPVAPKGA